VASWSRIATRLRVPLGFLFALAYLWLARPVWWSIALGAGLVIAGLVVRGLASGHIQKNAALATTGPYAYTRNPLYLGSILIAVGFLVSALDAPITFATAVLFVVIYLPVIRAEEAYLRSAFAEYADYSANVPRLLPRLTPYRAGTTEGQGEFSRALYMRHREYNAILGSLVVMVALILKMVLVHRH